MSSPPLHVVDQDHRVLVSVESDIMVACREARRMAERLGFSRSGVYHIATAASELAANLFIHAGGGLLRLRALTCCPWSDAGLAARWAARPPPDDQRVGLELIAEDQGPGIADLALALTDGYSTSGGLGCGLPGVKRLMDDFVIASEPGRGTSVRAIKWR